MDLKRKLFLTGFFIFLVPVSAVVDISRGSLMSLFPLRCPRAYYYPYLAIIIIAHGLVYSIHDPTDEAIRKMIEASQ